MSTLTLDVGVTNLVVDCQKAGHAAPRKVGGDRSYAFGGAETASTRGEMMVVPVVLAPLPTATVSTIRGLFALGKQVPCSGDVFNRSGTITCSGMITDELRETQDSWIVSLTLYEIASVAPPVIPAVYLSNLADNDTGANKKAWTTIEGGFANLGSRRILNEATLTTCGTTPDPTLNCPITYTDVATPEVIWLSTAFLANGTLFGRPTVSILSKGGTGDKWQTQNCFAKLELVRAGAVVATVNTAYAGSNGGFAGSTITMQAAAGTAIGGLIGDRVRIKIYGRIGLHGGYTDGNNGVDDLNRQTITWGWGGAGYDASLSWGGLADVMDPP